MPCRVQIRVWDLGHPGPSSRPATWTSGASARPWRKIRRSAGGLAQDCNSASGHAAMRSRGRAVVQSCNASVVLRPMAWCCSTPATDACSLGLSLALLTLPLAPGAHYVQVPTPGTVVRTVGIHSPPSPRAPRATPWLDPPPLRSSPSPPLDFARPLSSHVIPLFTLQQHI